VDLGVALGEKVGDGATVSVGTDVDVEASVEVAASPAVGVGPQAAKKRIAPNASKNGHGFIFLISAPYVNSLRKQPNMIPATGALSPLRAQEWLVSVSAQAV
jgi:hypothetical protein